MFWDRAAYVKKIFQNNWFRAVLVLFAAFGLLLALLTSSEPWVQSRAPVTAQQVQIARVIFGEVRKSRETGQPVELSVGGERLAAVSALVSQGFAPNRLDAEVQDGVFTARVSRPLGFRWVNIRADAYPSGKGFPEVRFTIGKITLPASLSRILLEQFLKSQTSDLPPLDELVHSFSVGKENISAKLLLPASSVFKSQMQRQGKAPDMAMVGKIYCALASQQQERPDSLFVHQLHRAVKASEPTEAGHASALVALAMITVDPKSAELMGGVSPDISRCEIPVIQTTLQGRHDWAMHWSVTAALTVTTNSQLANAVGEWKELADSTSGSALLAKNDPSGFSLADIAADRAGIMTAQKLTHSGSLQSARKWVLEASENQILPQEATEFGDGLTEEELADRYGDIESPRYREQVRKIDKILKKSI